MEFELDLENLETKTKVRNKVHQIPNCQLLEFEAGIDYKRLCLEALCSQLPNNKKEAFKKKVEKDLGVRLFPQFYCIED